jgi:hypothetical protein
LIGSLFGFWPVNTDRTPFAQARGRRNHYLLGIAAGRLSNAAKVLFFGANIRRNGDARLRRGRHGGVVLYLSATLSILIFTQKEIRLNKPSRFRMSWLAYFRLG